MAVIAVDSIVDTRTRNLGSTLMEHNQSTSSHKIMRALLTSTDAKINVSVKPKEKPTTFLHPCKYFRLRQVSRLYTPRCLSKNPVSQNHGTLALLEIEYTL